MNLFLVPLVWCLASFLSIKVPFPPFSQRLAPVSSNKFYGPGSAANEKLPRRVVAINKGNSDYAECSTLHCKLAVWSLLHPSMATILQQHMSISKRNGQTPFVALKQTYATTVLLFLLYKCAKSFFFFFIIHYSFIIRQHKIYPLTFFNPSEMVSRKYVTFFRHAYVRMYVEKLLTK